jgi:F-type H+-transporting ATPase subunit gamma
VLIIAADRGLAGGYNSNVLKESERLVARLRRRARRSGLPRRAPRGELLHLPPPRVRRGVDGFTEKPTFENAREIGERSSQDFTDPDDLTASTRSTWSTRASCRW